MQINDILELEEDILEDVLLSDDEWEAEGDGGDWDGDDDEEEEGDEEDDGGLGADDEEVFDEGFED